MRYLASVSVFALGLLTSGACFGAPFCVVTSSGKQCWYYDEPSCERAAAAGRGGCIVNPDEVRAPSSGAPFCVVTSYGTNCWYYDAPSCQQAAASARGRCVAR